MKESAKLGNIVRAADPSGRSAWASGATGRRFAKRSVRVFMPRQSFRVTANNFHVRDQIAQQNLSRRDSEVARRTTSGSVDIAPSRSFS